jgi:enoyl-CoA hydratase/carnithine racemase
VQDAQGFVKQIAGTSAPMSLMMMKRQVYRHLNQELHDAMVESDKWMAESLKRPDFEEGVAAFVERRPPNFTKVEA